jgi:hypothetical protein
MGFSTGIVSRTRLSPSTVSPSADRLDVSILKASDVMDLPTIKRPASSRA